MERGTLVKLLEALSRQEISVEEATDRLRHFPSAEMPFATVDHHRSLRTGFPEVIFCQGKTPEHVVSIAKKQIEHDETVFGTRASGDILDAIRHEIPDIETNEIARCFWRKSSSWVEKTAIQGDIVVVSAGTADMPVAEEARCTIEILGHPCTAVYDVGVAGIHRLFAHHELLGRAAVLIVVAGMEGALPSVVTGLVSAPVIGVPTSVGYGSNLGGLVALLAMLNSCASGLSVVNIDNGFGAGFSAVRINSLHTQR
ncbi:MAG: nickel pincer cofactor biosynthesis protein LarB [Chitinivibrionales bacterium]|nr:nickel pincer cofactor biosynthesis protein LarB [Chitinivibrionales bacterium]MBD3356047.1 nickel pincer cofactor biosynthesis protein LarB [Chitinivibrionales bacterium]